MLSKTCRDMIALLFVPGIGPRKLMSLLSEVKDTEEIFYLPDDVIYRIIGRYPGLAAGIRNARKTAEYEKEMMFLSDEGINAVCCEDPGYPEALSTLYSPPPVLFMKGAIDVNDMNAVAAVGSRRCSLYGLQAAEKLAFELARNGVTVVSGMAKGIDSAAHRGAIRAGGRTIAVMGTGFRNIYPAGSERLLRDISENGAVITEFSSDVGASKSNFPRRNRIISGLSKAVVVVEAEARSGALITVDFALEQGRDVFAVPGRIGERTSMGTNRLIQSGAKLITCVEDILEEINVTAAVERDNKNNSTETLDMSGLSDEERAVVGRIGGDAVHIDDIGEGIDIRKEVLPEILLRLELKGKVKALAGGSFKLRGAVVGR
ncbi:MAG: DNA-processing protein DprA [Candidatus Omnitrophota bacterium]